MSSPIVFMWILLMPNDTNHNAARQTLNLLNPPPSPCPSLYQTLTLSLFPSSLPNSHPLSVPSLSTKLPPSLLNLHPLSVASLSTRLPPSLCPLPLYQTPTLSPSHPPTLSPSDPPHYIRHIIPSISSPMILPAVGGVIDLLFGSHPAQSRGRLI